MNAKDLTRNRSLFAAILGVAAVAAIGLSAAHADSVQTNQTTQPPQIQGSINLQQNILSNVQTKFSAAADTAQAAVGNGTVIGGSLTVMQGYVVYAFNVVDNKNMAYSVIIDPANGKVLYTSPGHQMHFGGMLGMGQGGMKHGWHHKGSMQGTQPPAGTAPSGNTSPTSGSTDLPTVLRV